MADKYRDKKEGGRKTGTEQGKLQRFDKKKIKKDKKGKV